MQETILEHDEATLKKLGYAQDLMRSLGGFSNFAISFSVISILTGSITLYGYGLTTAGPRGIILGWMIVSIASIPIALSMAELASAFPTAGALYHWASFLGNRHWGWFTAWLNYLGQFAITAGIDYGLAEFLYSLWSFETTGAKFLIYALVLFSHGIINHYGIRWVDRFNQISAWYHVVGVALLVGGLAYFAPLKPLSFLWQASTTKPFPYWWAFCLGLLQAQWTISGYDASAHVSEETVDVSKKVPFGMILSVVSSGVLGLVMLVFITLAIPDLKNAESAQNPFIYIMQTALGHRLGSGMVWLCVIAMWFCGLSSLTSNSRMLYAFARDGGVPGHKFISQVSRTYRTPHYAIWISAFLAFCLALYGQAYDVVVSLSTVFIFSSYLLPIGIAAWAQWKGMWKEKGAFDLKKFSIPCNVFSCLWISFIVVVLVLPPNTLTLYGTLTSVLLLCFLYLFAARTRFRGVTFGGAIDVPV